MNDAIVPIAGGIKCDNSTCDYRDDDVPVSGYPDWLNRPCPKCGSNLLTEADYQAVKSIFELIDSINKTAAEISIDPANGEDELATVRFTFNGNGTPAMEVL